MVRKVSKNPAGKADPYQALKDRIKPVHELPLVVSALFYGRSGTGKTTLAASFPKPALMLDIREKGTDSVFDVKGLDVLSVNSWQDIEDVYWLLKKNSHYKTVILDQVSALQDLCQAEVLSQEDKTQMSQRLYGEVSSRMKTWLLSYRDLIEEGINVIFLAHDRTFGNDDGDDSDFQIDPAVGPRVMPSVATVLTGCVKIIACTFIQEKLGLRDVKTKQRSRTVKYCIRLGAHGVYTTKLRTSKSTPVPPVVSNPSYEKLVQLMRGGGEMEQEENPAVKSRIRRSK